MPINFSIIVNAQQVAAQLQQQAESIAPRLRQEVERLSVSAHAFIVKKAEQKLSDRDLKMFLGEDNKNVRWSKVGESIWVVEIDDSVRDIEEGRERKFMEWLLTKNAKAKRAKDGSMYASIPMPKVRFAGPGAGSVNSSRADLAAMVSNAMRDSGISLKKIEKNADGTPKTGILHKLDPQLPGTQSQFPTLFSMPRSNEMAALTGLKPHGGIPLTQGAVVLQRWQQQNNKSNQNMQKGKIVREAVTFRTISSKHEAEGRWFLKAKPGLHAMQEAYEYAQQEWTKIVQRLQEEFGGR